ncbi:MAG: hypothetical protein AMXMBFR77_13590 [Phycisphaerales bacterium]|nr:hypothetical protein [Phycisphaerales bacterium]MDL1905101.1 hypothetical protein [Synechococcales cyanobacterium CNB]GIK19352.1 MAG: hypothetical protein BroJett004_15160 [Planctomycetota bacterium]
MVRAIAGVIVAYLVMAMVTVVAFFGLYAVVGVDGAFREGTYEPSPVWIACSVVIGVAAALLGGALCALIGRSKRAAQVLAALLLVFGLAYAAGSLKGPQEVVVRPADVPAMEAMQNARTPAWMGVLNALIGATGVMVGATMVLKKRDSGAKS